jgi:hypothetical protein
MAMAMAAVRWRRCDGGGAMAAVRWRRCDGGGAMAAAVGDPIADICQMYGGIFPATATSCSWFNIADAPITNQQ